MGRAAFALGLLAITLVAPAAHAALIYGSTGTNGLVSFDSATPGALLSSVQITGLGAGEQVLGIDFRPANATLYAITRDASNGGRVYSVDTATGAATLASPLAVALGGEAGFGTDFNPTVDHSASSAPAAATAASTSTPARRRSTSRCNTPSATPDSASRRPSAPRPTPITSPAL